MGNAGNHTFCLEIGPGLVVRLGPVKVDTGGTLVDFIEEELVGIVLRPQNICNQKVRRKN